MNQHTNRFQATETGFDQARDIANFAARLDDIKHLFDPNLQELVGACVDYLHELAAWLAGDRVEEIYPSGTDLAELLEVIE